MDGKKTAVALAAFLVASFLIDNAAMNLMNAIRSPLLTSLVTAFNKFYLWIYIALTLATIAAVVKSKGKEGKAKAIVTMAASIVASIAATHLLKPIIHRARPDGISLVNPLFGIVDYSFPSGHTSAATAAAFSTPMLKAPWAAFAILTMFTRVYSNAHFLSDIAGGIIVAAALSWLVKKTMKAKLTDEDRMELKRQTLHAVIGIAIAVFIRIYPALWYVVAGIAAAGIGLSFLIKRKARLRSLAVTLLKHVQRKDELKRFPGKGAIMLFIGAGLTAAIFRQEAVAAIIILAVGDSVSHLAGRLFGRVKHKRPFIEEKMVEGTVAGFVFAAAAAATILPVWTAILSAAAGMIFEAVHIRIAGRKIDDNLSVPLVAAAVMWGLRLFSGF